MSIVAETRLSDSPYVETITHGQTLSDGSTIRPAESNWHMVIVKQHGVSQVIVVGPLTASGNATWQKEAEIVWVKFKLGTFMPHLPVKRYLDQETMLPNATKHSFWLHGSTWQFPDHNNVETFIDRLVRNEMLVQDPLIGAVLQDQAYNDQLSTVSPRTIRHRFLRSTGLTQGQIRQMERARQAVVLLEQGVPILDVVYESGYFDQPHLTRSLKQWIGYTPAQIVQSMQAKPPQILVSEPV